MTTLIAIDSSTEICSVALLRPGVVRDRHSETGVRQSEQMLGWIAGLLAEADLAPSAIDGLAVAIGPGAFTGVRLGVAVAQGLALAWDRPLAPVSTLAALATRMEGDNTLPVLVAQDARMGEVYAGWFAPSDSKGTPEAMADEAVLAPDALVRPDGVSGYVAIGSAFAEHGPAIIRALGQPARLAPLVAPGAAAVGALALRAWPVLARPPECVVPVYLRDKVALTSAERGSR